MYAEILGGYPFQREVLGQKPPENKKDIIVISKDLFSVLNCMDVMVKDYVWRKSVFVK